MQINFRSKVPCFPYEMKKNIYGLEGKRKYGINHKYVFFFFIAMIMYFTLLCFFVRENNLILLCFVGWSCFPQMPVPITNIWGHTYNYAPQVQQYNGKFSSKLSIKLPQLTLWDLKYSFGQNSVKGFEIKFLSRNVKFLRNVVDLYSLTLSDSLPQWNLDLNSCHRLLSFLRFKRVPLMWWKSGNIID